MISDDPGEEPVARALEAGTTGLVGMEIDAPTLCGAVVEVAAVRRVFSDRAP